MSTSRLGTHLYAASLGSKPLILGEYAWSQTEQVSLATFLATVRAYPGVVGDTYWSLFGHADASGYVPHYDGHTIHYPGDNAAMRSAAQELRSHAYGIRSAPVPVHGTPLQPANFVVTPYIFGYAFMSWRGAAIADRYLVQYASSPGGPWTNACRLTGGTPACPTDNTVPVLLGPVPAGLQYFRIQGVNLGGVGGPFVEPVLTPVPIVW